jgi:hypothetical protein
MRLLSDRPALFVALAGLIGGLILAAGARPIVHGQEGSKKIQEGQPAPDVELPATQVEKVLPEKKDAKTLHLKDLQGKKNVVLYFFPKAGTRG